MKDRFDLEQEINALYGFSEQLSTISEAVLEERLSTDETVNAIEGIRVLMDLQAQKLHDTMCQILKLDNYKEYV
jgi:hypothetical protein